MRKKYSKAKINFQTANRSGTGAKAVEKARKKIEEFNYLSWLDEHITQRTTRTNVDDDESDDEVAYDGDGIFEKHFDGISDNNDDEEEEGEFSPGVFDNPEPVNTIQKKKLTKKAKPKVPRIEKPTKVKFWEKSRDIEKEEILVMRALAKKFDETPSKNVSGRDTCEIYGELVASKLRKLDSDVQEEAQMAIDSVLMTHRIRNQQRREARRPLTAVDNYDINCTSPTLPVHPRQRFSQPRHDLSPVPTFYRPSSTPGQLNQSDLDHWSAASSSHSPLPYTGFNQVSPE